MDAMVFCVKQREFDGCDYHRVYRKTRTKSLLCWDQNFSEEVWL